MAYFVVLLVVYLVAFASARALLTRMGVLTFMRRDLAKVGATALAFALVGHALRELLLPDRITGGVFAASRVAEGILALEMLLAAVYLKIVHWYTLRYSEFVYCFLTILFVRWAGMAVIGYIAIALRNG